MLGLSLRAGRAPEFLETYVCLEEHDAHLDCVFEFCGQKSQRSLLLVFWTSFQLDNGIS